jgi:hypothetical protein
MVRPLGDPLRVVGVEGGRTANPHVGTRAERPTGAGHQDHAHGVTGVRRFERGEQFARLTGMKAWACPAGPA